MNRLLQVLFIMLAYQWMSVVEVLLETIVLQLLTLSLEVQSFQLSRCHGKLHLCVKFFGMNTLVQSFACPLIGQHRHARRRSG
jgi:hypothetical protein